jgi:hypothetical protein
MRAALMGCGGVALLCVLAFVGLMLYSRKNPGMFLDFAMRNVESRFGPNVTDQDRKDLRDVVAELKDAIRENRIRANRNAGWQGSFGFRTRSETISHEDVREIIRGFREAIVPVRSASPSPAPATVPTPP